MLRITLRDGEVAIVNGALLRAEGRVTLRLENHAALLRGRDVMLPEDATTPARQLYFAAMLAYLEPEDRDTRQHEIIAHLEQVVGAAQTPEARVVCVRFALEAARGDYYRALGAARALIALEAPLAAAA